ncbi:MAG TPA: acyl-ACP--UDP-N-acetylglucosamine O-acyltransferase [Scandinavium sp.]|jgi:UDP-N-acetylglucosamine acyltransferase
MSISSSARIASNSLVAPGATLGANVRIGPFCIISADVVIGEGTTVGAYSVINGFTTIGHDNHIGLFCSLGEVNQDLKYAAEPTTLVIGDRNQIGKNATLHRGTVQGRSCTLIGNDNRLLNNVHIGHDCVVGNNTIIRDNSGLAGHVELGDGVDVGFMCAIHQFCVLGAHVKINSQSGVVQDIPPFVMAGGNHARPLAIFAESETFLSLTISQRAFVHEMYAQLYHQSLPIDEVKRSLTLQDDTMIASVFAWFFARSKRGIIR